MVLLNQEREIIQQKIDSGEISPELGKYKLFLNDQKRNWLKSNDLDTIGNSNPEYRNKYDRLKLESFQKSNEAFISHLEDQKQIRNNIFAELQNNSDQRRKYRFLRDYFGGKFNGPLTQEQQQLVDDSMTQGFNQEYGVNYTSED